MVRRRKNLQALLIVVPHVSGGLFVERRFGRQGGNGAPIGLWVAACCREDRFAGCRIGKLLVLGGDLIRLNRHETIGGDRLGALVDPNVHHVVGAVDVAG